MSDGYDPKQIDISLSLLSGEDSQAAKDLADSLKKTAEYFDTIQKSDFSSFISKLDAVADKLAAAAGQGTYRGSASSGASVAGSPQQATDPGASIPQAPSEAQARSSTAAASRLFDPATNQGWNATDTSSSTGMADMSSGTSAGWLNRLNQFNPVARGGSVLRDAAQNYVKEKVGADALERLGENPTWTQQEDGTPGLLTVMKEHGGAQIPGWIATAAAFNASKLWQHVKFGGWLPGNIENSGWELGFGRQGEQHVGPFGILPGSQYGSQAGQEGMAEKLYAQIWAKSLGGLNSEQAQGIIAATTSAGFAISDGTGMNANGMGGNIARNLMTPVFQETGMDPEIQKEFLGSIRTGAASLDRVKDSLLEMGSAARASHMDMHQFAAEVLGVAEGVQAAGGTFQMGVERANAFATATGLPPATANAVAQSPIFQTFAAGQTGLPPQLQGLLGPAAFGNVMDKAVKFEMGVYKGLFRPIHTPITGANGEVIGEETITPRQQQLAATAQNLGIKPDEIRKILSDKHYVASFQLSAAANKFGQQSRLGIDLEAGHAGGVTWAELSSAALAHGGVFTPTEIARIGKLDYRQRAKAIQKDLSNEMESKGKHMLGLTPQAARLVRLLDTGANPTTAINEAAARNAGATKNSLAVSAQGNKPFGWGGFGYPTATPNTPNTSQDNKPFGWGSFGAPDG